MKIINDDLLREFRTPGRCECCNRHCKYREGHHLFARGAGGGSRLDVRINLLALGRTEMFQCFCHSDSHAGLKPTRADMLEVVAERECTTPEDIELVIYLLKRLPKAARLEQVYREYADLPTPTRQLAERVLVEAGVFGG